MENYHPALEIINSGNGTSLLGGHDQQQLNTGKLLLLLIALFAFALVSATYWQFLEKGRSAIDTTILVDDLSTESYIDNELELDDDSSIDAYIDNVLKLVDDLSTDARSNNEHELDDDLSTDIRIDNESELNDGLSTDIRIDNEPELDDNIPTDARSDNELDEWFGSNK